MSCSRSSWGHVPQAVPDIAPSPPSPALRIVHTGSRLERPPNLSSFPGAGGRCDVVGHHHGVVCPGEEDPTSPRMGGRVGQVCCEGCTSPSVPIPPPCTAALCPPGRACIWGKGAQNSPGSWGFWVQFSPRFHLCCCHHPLPPPFPAIRPLGLA